jgi:hypothetical protein
MLDAVRLDETVAIEVEVGVRLFGFNLVHPVPQKSAQTDPAVVETKEASE